MTTEHAVATTRPKSAESHGLRAELVHTLASVAASRAAWLFAAAWMLAALTLVVSGQGFPFDSLIIVGVYLPLSLVTVLLTRPAPPAPAAAAERPRLRLQVGLILLFVVLTGWSGLVFHDVVGGSIPAWTPLVDALGRLGDTWFGAGTWVTNPVTYVGLPLLVLLLAGARVRSLGFGPGHRVGRVLLLWGSIPLAMFAVAIVSGQLTLGRLLGRFVSNFMQNGFLEEFLFRGALQTRLRRLLTPAWAVVIQALGFGIWHLGLGFTNTDHAGLLPALASTVVNQAVIGLAFGVIFERTRNLVAPSIAHVLANSMG
jgi:membrane protease YdiL (CAAX protease family)